MSDQRPALGDAPAGWYPDPWRTGALRYWDGAAWTGYTDAADRTATAVRTGGARHGDPGSDRRPRRRSRLAPIKWGALGAFAVGVVVLGIALARGQQVRTVDVRNGKIELFAVDDVAPKDIERAQDDIAARVEQLEAQAEASTAGPVADSAAQFAGTWFADTGVGYQIQQFGDSFVIQEMTQFGVSAYGEGTIEGTEASFTFAAIDGSGGSGVLELVDGGVIQASFLNTTWGESSATLRRG